MSHPPRPSEPLDPTRPLDGRPARPGPPRAFPAGAVPPQRLPAQAQSPGSMPPGTGLPPAFRPGVAAPSYAPPPAYPPTPAQSYAPPPAYPPTPAHRPVGSNAPLWLLIGMFAVLLCGGAGAAAMIAFRNGEDATSADPGRSAPAVPGPAGEPSDRPTAPPTAPSPTAPDRGAASVITYEITGDGPATITYIKERGSASQREHSAELPWRAEVPAPEGAYLASVIASRTGTGEGSINCRVLVDGAEVASNTRTGPIASVVCLKLVVD